MEIGLGVIYHFECVNFMSFRILHIMVGTLLSSEADTSRIFPTSGYQTSGNEQKCRTDVPVLVG